jgi:hypothetical protein
MKRHNNVFIAIGILLVAIVFAAGNFRFIRGHKVSGAYPCVNNLRVISGAKDSWALEKNKTTNDTPTWNDLRPFLPDRWTNGPPICPQGGTYTIGRVGEPPTCSIGGRWHAIPQ